MTDRFDVKKTALVVGGLALVAGAFYLTRRRPTVRKLDAVVISGPSGVGKGTLITMLMKDYPKTFRFSVSHTTRAPRSGETNGKEYHFVARDDMLKMIDNGEFLESCQVHDNIYGTSKAALNAVRQEGKVAIIEMDVQGAQKLKTKQGDLNFHYLFITAPAEELEKRITKRGADSPEKIRVRLETAKKEFDFVQSNPGFYDTILVNDTVEDSYAKLCTLIRSLGVTF